jgi:hypothetical protein
LDDLSAIPADTDYPIFITHTKPAQNRLIMAEIQQLSGHPQAQGRRPKHISWLHAGQEFEL